MAAKSSKTNSMPNALGRYELIGEIARGGMATIYLARLEAGAGFQRLFAVKVMHEHLREQEEFVSMLIDEARIAGKLHHPNAVSTLELGEWEGGPFLVLDYVEGASLSDLLRAAGEDRRPEMIIPLVRDALAGLHAAHELEGEDGKPLNLVHRDISAGNVLVGIDGVGRLSDFGIAKARERLTHTDPGMMKGKAGYMSPEHVLGKELDRRSDLFSMGVVLWNALTGRRLFKAPDARQQIFKVINDDAPAPSTMGLRPHPAFDEVILRALSRDRDKRFNSAREMSEALSVALKAYGKYATRDELATWVRETASEEIERRKKMVLAKPQKGLTDEMILSGSFSMDSLVSAVSETASGTSGLRRFAPYIASAVLAAAGVALALSTPGDSEASSTNTQASAAEIAPSPPPPVGAGPVQAEKNEVATRSTAAVVEASAPQVVEVVEKAEPVRKRARLRRVRPVNNATPAPEAQTRAAAAPVVAAPTPEPAPARVLEDNPYLRAH